MDNAKGWERLGEDGQGPTGETCWGKWLFWV